MELVRFPNKVGFYSTLKARVNAEFQRTGRSKKGNSVMFFKSAVILAGFVASYIGLVFYSSSIWLALGWGLALVQFYTMIGCNIQHDGNHGSYSSHKLVNRLAGATLDCVGASSLFWRSKHNFLHHIYTNIQELDSDLNTFGLLRLSPYQDWRPWHRLQQWYFLLTYSLVAINWIYIDDFKTFLSGKIANYRLSPLSRLDAALFIFFKIFYIFFAWILPLAHHSFVPVLIGNLLVIFGVGLTLAMIFNLAHIMGEEMFPTVKDGCIEEEWAIHQIETTADFAPKNPIVCWYTGGLNFQVEHHLFPDICHVHYPEIRQIVQETCKEFGVNYVCYDNLGQALGRHVATLKNLGKKPLQAQSTSA